MGDVKLAKIFKFTSDAMRMPENINLMFNWLIASGINKNPKTKIP